jgi:multidrug efflux pump subunit AcrA (membrane-fusion protein)
VVRIKAGKKGTSGTIKWVIDDGSHVEKGQKLVEVDDSALQEELKEQIIKVNKARNDWVTAGDNLKITESTNFSAIESAKTVKDLAEIILKKFLGEKVAAKVLVLKERSHLQKYLGELDADLANRDDSAVIKEISEILQTKFDIEGRIGIARSDKQTLEDKAAWSQRMVKKGYLSRTTAESDKSRLSSAEFTWEKAKVEFDLFKKYTIEEKVTDLWSKVKEADRAFDRANIEANSKLSTAQSDLESKKAIYDQEVDRKDEIEDEIQKCTMYAPQSGLVVYHVSEQSKWGSGSSQSIVAATEPVKEGQKLMRIPNLERMLVNTRVHEAMVSKLKGEVNRPTGFSEVVRAGFAVNPLAITTAGMHLSVADWRVQYREHDFETLYPGQRAYIRVEAHPSKIFQGRVKSVATVSATGDWMSSDVKVYQTMVSIDETVMNLKPGMSAQVTIVAEESTEPVLTIPIQSVAGSIAMGAKRKCYVIENGQPKARDIVVGRSNDNKVEVTEGLSEGESVVLNPRPLLGENSGMKTGTPATRRGIDADEMGGAGGKKFGGKKKGGPDGVFPGGPNGPGGPGGPGGLAPGGGKQFNRPEGAFEKKS